MGLLDPHSGGLFFLHAVNVDKHCGISMSRIVKVSIMCVSTLCGRIEPSGIGSHRDRLRLEKARARTQASLLGASSLRNGDPEMRCEGGVLPESRVRAFITSSGDIPEDRKIFRHGPVPVVFTSEAGYEKLSAGVRRAASVHVLRPAPEGGLCLRQALGVLWDMGVENMLIEGGGVLNYHAIRQGVVNEVLLTLAPRIVGSDNAAMLFSGHGHAGSPFVNLDLVECRQVAESGELFLRYRVRDASRAFFSER